MFKLEKGHNAQNYVSNMKMICRVLHQNAIVCFTVFTTEKSSFGIPDIIGYFNAKALRQEVTYDYFYIDVSSSAC